MSHWRAQSSKHTKNAISQRVVRAQSKTQSHRRFAPSTRPISAEGRPRPDKNAISPAFRAFDAHEGCLCQIQNAISPAFHAVDMPDLCRGLPATGQKRNLTCISRLRHARARQKVARDRTKTQSHLHFAPSTCTISAEGCARPDKNAISPAFRALDAHDLRRRLTFVMLRRYHPHKRARKEERGNLQM